MPVLTKNHTSKALKGSLTAVGTFQRDFTTIGMAFDIVRDLFDLEHGREPDLERCTFQGGWTTCELAFELIEAPEEDDD